MNNTIRSQKVVQTLNTIVRYAVPALIGVVGFVSSMVIYNSIKIAEMAGNRYTSGDALKDQRRLDDKLYLIKDTLSDMKVDVADIKGKIPKEIPPEWFYSEFEILRDEVKILHQDVHQNSIDLQTIKSKLNDN